MDFLHNESHDLAAAFLTIEKQRLAGYSVLRCRGRRRRGLRHLYGRRLNTGKQRFGNVLFSMQPFFQVGSQSLNRHAGADGSLVQHFRQCLALKCRRTAFGEKECHPLDLNGVFGGLSFAGAHQADHGRVHRQLFGQLFVAGFCDMHQKG